MTSVRFTRRAAAALADIADWTYGRFGPAQAESYRDELIAACRALVRASPTERRVEGFKIGNGDDVRYVRAAMHFIVFRRRESEVAILDLLHVRSDLASRLEQLSKGD